MKMSFGMLSDLRYSNQSIIFVNHHLLRIPIKLEILSELHLFRLILLTFCAYYYKLLNIYNGMIKKYLTKYNFMMTSNKYCIIIGTIGHS
jgi:hypothetical protein